MRATVLLLGTLDTKGAEYAYVRDRLTEAGVATLVVDAGTGEPQAIDPDISRDELAEAADTTPQALADAGDRGAAVQAMGAGAEAVVRRLFDEGRFDGILAFGGSGGSSIAAAAMRALPFGRPQADGLHPRLGRHAPVRRRRRRDDDVLGRRHRRRQPVSARIMANAAAAIAGMVQARPAARSSASRSIAATMFGVTTPCVTRARERLEELGYEVLVFHATGAGGQSMEALAADGFLAGVLDVTTTELADELVGGVLSAGPDRLEAAGEAGIPQVVSLGALDMVNFGPRETRPGASSRAGTSTSTTRP